MVLVLWFWDLLPYMASAAIPSLKNKLQQEGILVSVVHKEDPLFNGLERVFA
jgi:hypothetical protein